MMKSNVQKWTLSFVMSVSFLVAGVFVLYHATLTKKNNVLKVVKEEHTMFFIENNKITTMYGTELIEKKEEKVILDLIQSAAFQRTRHIHQYGVMKWIKNQPPYSRFSHCLGVWALLRRYNAPLNEQIAGLLHDVSHTVFSHVGDHVFNHHSEGSSYQDDIHEWFLRKYSIDKILNNYGIELRSILHKAAGFKMLEQDLPDICADRLDYNLRGGMVAGILKLEEVEPILQKLCFENGRWFFTDPAAAAKFARISVYLTEHEFGSLENGLVYKWAAKAIQRALELQVITFDEVHFSTDDIIWERLLNATDEIIKKYIHMTINYKSQFHIVGNNVAADIIIRTKFRGINPWVRVNNEFKRLYEIDPLFAKEYDRVSMITRNGWAVNLVQRDAVAMTFK